MAPSTIYEKIESRKIPSLAGKELKSRNQKSLKKWETIIPTKNLFWVAYYDDYLNLIMVYCNILFFLYKRETVEFDVNPLQH